jgi:Chromosome segregation ATPases
MQWIELFAVGTHTDSSGKIHTFTEADLERMVTTHDPAVHEVPLVLGHPKTDAPAWGWVQALKAEGGKLLASFRDVPELVREAVAKGRYKKRSISLYPDGRLRHVGLLGAAVPAVQGLKDIVDFSGDEAEGVLEFTENLEDDPMDLKELEAKLKALETENALLKARAEGADSAKIAELEKQLKELQSAKEKAEADKEAAEAAFAAAQKSARELELKTRVDDLVAAGNILPQDAPKALAFAARLDAPEGDAGDLQFSETDGKKPAVAWFFDFLGSLPAHGLTREFAAPSGDSPQEAAIPNDLTMKV